MQDVLEPILKTPRMRMLMNELEIRWKDEQRLREKIYHDIQPGNKWEFINGKIIMHSPAKKKTYGCEKEPEHVAANFCCCAF